MWFTTRYYWYQFSSWFKPYSVKVLSFLIQKLSLFFNLNQIRVSELSIGFNLSYLNDLTRSRRKGLLFVQVNQDTRSAQIPQKQHGSNTYILKTHHLTNLWVIHLRRGYLSDPVYVHPYKQKISFFHHGPCSITLSISLLHCL